MFTPPLQRGKFTLDSIGNEAKKPRVSNPNGVNLHLDRDLWRRVGFEVSNPNGVNLHFSKENIYFLLK